MHRPICAALAVAAALSVAHAHHRSPAAAAPCYDDSTETRCNSINQNQPGIPLTPITDRPDPTTEY